ncbi:hypothetical protein CFN78_23430 [Amycolatopsis antarctica]|uniref:Uncharacterized protein n=1 Tax=Amycolatopsis antarctica TaxID=1854586 RepID=A0A263CXL6_9PSEU|nr:DUF1707 domain-containing protein [Amycolatopsis antarctica]OZM70882.1 hypothetical protein CFN78_23430 [Amycolatopsis antarctica]
MAADPDDSLRIGTNERDEAARALGEHFSEGRLDVDEYELRVAAAIAAATRADMRPLFDDLPDPAPAFLRPPPSAQPPFPPAPYGYPNQPMYPPPMGLAAMPPLPQSHKSKVAAGVLQILLPFGAGRFYTGHAGMAIAQLLVVLFTFGVGAIWPVIDGVILLANGGVDSLGRKLRD